MNLMSPRPGFLGVIAMAALASACTSGGGNGTGPAPVPTVAQVVITSPAAAPVIGALGRTVQFTAEARDARGAVVAATTLAWSSSNPAVATVTTSGLVTAVSNGTTSISASASGTSGSLGLSVNQVTAQLVITPGTRTFGATGSQFQFTSEARDSSGNVVAGRTPAWVSRDPTVATVVSATGVVTSAGTGTTRIVATADGTADSATVTVNLVVASLAVAPSAVAFGALGATRQLTATVLDSGGTVIPGRTVTWSNVTNTGAASVNGTGLVSSAVVGAETIRASASGPTGPITKDVAVTVTQVVPAVTVTSAAGASPDTLKTTTRQRTFLAAAADSNGNNIPGLTFAWVSTVPAVATVDATGVATAVADGTTAIQASSGGKTGSRVLVVRRYAETFTLAPPSASITTKGGTQLFTGVAKDSVGTDLVISWASEAPSIVVVAPATGSVTGATATSNGSTNVVMSGGTRSISAPVTATNQIATAATVTIGNFFFKSDHNNSQNTAVDTVAVGGTVTWTWTGSPTSHGVLSTGSPSFVSSSIQATGTYAMLFTTAGTYTYECAVHGPLMTGRVVVR